MRARRWNMRVRMVGAAPSVVTPNLILFGRVWPIAFDGTRRVLVLLMLVAVMTTTPTGPSFASAAESAYYVAPSGSDTTGDGSSVNPWATIQRAASAISGGDTVHVTAGTYGPFTISKAGMSGAYTQFIADGPVVVSGGANGITIKADYVRLVGFTIEGHTQHGIFNYGYDFTDVSGCEIRDDTGTAPNSYAAVYLAAGTGHVIDSCSIHDLNAGGVHFIDCSASTVSNSEIHDLAEDGIVVQGVGITIEGNTLHDLQNVTNHSDGIVVQAPWHMTYGADTSGTLIRNNTLYDCIQQIYIDAFGKAGCNITKTAIHNNVLYVTDASYYQTGINFDPERGSISDVDVYNNTFVDFNKAGASALRRTTRTAACSDFDIKNNVFDNSLFAYESAISSIAMDYNLYYRASGSIIKWLGTYYSSLTAFQSAVGKEAHGVWGSPGLTSTYRPGPESPVIGAGIGPTSDMNVPATDKAGVVRSGSVASIGAYEYAPSSTQLSASTSVVVPYRGRAVIAGALRTALLQPVPAKSVSLEILSGATWTAASVAVTNADGTFTLYSPALDRARIMRVVFNGDIKFLPTTCRQIRIVPRVHMSAPVAPAVMVHGRAYVVWGYLKPKHPSGTKPVRILCYQRQSGKWVLRRTYLAKVNTVTSGLSRYKASIRLPSAGRWRIRAYHAADQYNAATHSGWRYRRVK